jgi:alpha-amylase
VANQEQRVTADLSSYHGYWQTDLYKVNSAFGTEDDLKTLSRALHSRGMVWFSTGSMNDLELTSFS